MAGTYCAVGDVQSMFPNFPFPATAPTGNPNAITQATITNDIIPDVGQLIEDQLVKRYAVPITGTNALVTMKRIARLYAAAEVAERIYSGQGQSASTQAANWRSQADKIMQDIQSGQILLPDAPPNSDAPESRAAQVSSVTASPLSQTCAWFGPDRRRF